MMELDILYMNEVGAIISYVTADKKYQEVTIQTWDQAQVEWKKELLEWIYMNDKTETAHETRFP